MALTCFMCNAVYALNSACNPFLHSCCADFQLTWVPSQAGHVIVHLGPHTWKAQKLSATIVIATIVIINIDIVIIIILIVILLTYL